MPKVSILMSVYNKGDLLRQAIQSILDQSLADFEFIIRDNESTDNSVEIIKGFNDDRIKFSRNSRNLGPVGSLNNCIEQARGEYITFAHGDDIWDRNFLSTNAGYLDTYVNVSVSHSLMHTIDANDSIVYCQPDKRFDDHRIEEYQEVLTRLFKGCYIKTPTVFIRNKAVRYYNYRYMYTWDWDMYLNVAAARNDFLFINRPLIYYRVSTANETAIGMKGGDFILEGYLVLRNFFQSHREYSGYRKKAFNRLSASILRRSRDVDSRTALSFFLCFAILCYPVRIFSPVFHLYLFFGLLFGPSGVRVFKDASRWFKRLTMRHG
jgi:glycosyltransferase involved in cell wall biosynthesis